MEFHLRKIFIASIWKWNEYLKLYWKVRKSITNLTKVSRTLFSYFSLDDFLNCSCIVSLKHIYPRYVILCPSCPFKNILLFTDVFCYLFLIIFLNVTTINNGDCRKVSSLIFRTALRAWNLNFYKIIYIYWNKFPSAWLSERYFSYVRL